MAKSAAALHILVKEETKFGYHIIKVLYRR